MTKQYKQRLNHISVRSRDDPAEYARQYYWITVKHKSKAPPKQRIRSKKK
jgi:hypothetical protein